MIISPISVVVSSLSVASWTTPSISSTMASSLGVGTGRFSQAFSKPCRIFWRSKLVKRREHFRHSRRRRMVSPVRPSRESITLSSMLAQKGHFTREVLLMLGRISEIRYQKSGEKRRQGAEQSDRGGNGGRSPRRPAATEANPRTGLKTGHYNGKPKSGPPQKAASTTATPRAQSGMTVPQGKPKNRSRKAVPATINSASGDFGVDLFVLVLAHAAQIAKRPSFTEQDGHAGQRARSKRDQPKHHRSSNCRFLFYSIQMRECNDGERLRAAAHAGKLHRGAYHGEDEDQHGIGKC